MKKIIMLKGLPASGKSTWAKEQVNTPKGVMRVCKDDLRMMLHNGEWSKDNERMVLAVRDSIVAEALKANKTVIVDDTNLDPKHEAVLRDLADANKAEFQIKDFTDVSLQTCMERDAIREKAVGEKVIRDMHERYLKSKPVVLKQDHTLPRAIICDLDGTLALLNGRNPYDASECEKDLVNVPVRKLIGMIRDECHIVFMSGREEKYRGETLKWLALQGLIVDDIENFLFMRPTGDARKDSIVKEELFNKYVKDEFFVEFVLDDRDQVVKMWRDIGLSCLQVNYGNF